MELLIETDRTGRRAWFVAGAVFSGISGFGSGAVMGDSESCGMMGVFGFCQHRACSNAYNIELLEEYSTAITDLVSEIELSLKWSHLPYLLN